MNLLSRSRVEDAKPRTETVAPQGKTINDAGGKVQPPGARGVDAQALRVSQYQEPTSALAGPIKPPSEPFSGAPSMRVNIKPTGQPADIGKTINDAGGKVQPPGARGVDAQALRVNIKGPADKPEPKVLNAHRAASDLSLLNQTLLR